MFTAACGGGFATAAAGGGRTGGIGAAVIDWVAVCAAEPAALTTAALATALTAPVAEAVEADAALEAAWEATLAAARAAELAAAAAAFAAFAAALAVSAMRPAFTALCICARASDAKKREAITTRARCRNFSLVTWAPISGLWIRPAGIHLFTSLDSPHGFAQPIWNLPCVALRKKSGLYAQWSARFIKRMGRWLNLIRTGRCERNASEGR